MSFYCLFFACCVAIFKSAGSLEHRKGLGNEKTGVNMSGGNAAIEQAVTTPGNGLRLYLKGRQEHHEAVRRLFQGLADAIGQAEGSETAEVPADVLPSSLLEVLASVDVMGQVSSFLNGEAFDHRDHQDKRS